jgi:ATP-dependent RNA helicase RhlB
MKFTELNLDPKIQAGIRDAGFVECTKVQERTFEYSLEGIDVTVQSQTGTGKTAAFLISIFELFLKEEYFDDRFALIIVPTRELAVQIEQEARLLGKHLDFKMACVFGGMGYEEQERSLREGVDILIATPGRLLDFDRSGKVPLHDVGAFVIDEADRLFDMGFMPDVRKILRRVPPAKERWTMLSSATLDGRVRNLAWRDMSKPAEIAIEPEQVTVDTVTQSLYHVTKQQKLSLLLGLLDQEKPESALIFTNTKHAAEQVARRLSMNGRDAEFIIGDLPQKKRLQVIDLLKEGNLPILVATDVAARGLHIDDLDLVVNYDLPEHTENYVHRIGRTARAGKRGKAISLVCEEFVYGLEAIEEFTRKEIPVERAAAELFVTDRTAGVRVPHGPRHRPGDRRPGDRSARDRGPSGRPSSGDGRRQQRPADRRPADRRPVGAQDRRDLPARTERAAPAPPRPARTPAAVPAAPVPAAAVPAAARAGDLRGRLRPPAGTNGTQPRPAPKPAQKQPPAAPVPPPAPAKHSLLKRLWGRLTGGAEDA